MLSIYQPKDWLNITKELNIPVVKLIQYLETSRRNFYYNVKTNNASISLAIDFTNYINQDLDYEKVSVIPPEDMNNYFTESDWTYRSIDKICNLSYATIYKCIKNNAYVSFQVYKSFSDIVQTPAPVKPKPKSVKPKKKKKKPIVVQLETPAYRPQEKKWDFYEAQKEFLKKSTLKQ